MKSIKLTDTNKKDLLTHNEDFQDDYDKVDRFTDDNAHREKFTDYY
jgi:hypothetical protein